MWFVYILRSHTSRHLYVGSTNDLRKRLGQHKQGESRFTRQWQPWQLVSCVVLSSEKPARNLEHYFKTGSGRAFINKHILQ